VRSPQEPFSAEIGRIGDLQTADPPPYVPQTAKDHRAFGWAHRWSVVGTVNYELDPILPDLNLPVKG